MSYDAIDLSSAAGLEAEIRTSSRAVLRVPCAAIDPASRDVTFEVAVTAPGMGERRRRIHLAGEGAGRWHVLALRVPQGAMRLTIRASAEGTRTPSGAVCGVPSLTWRKSPRAVSRSMTFAVRTLGLSGTVRYLRTKVDADPAAQYVDWHRCHAPTPAVSTKSAMRGRSGISAAPRRRS